MSTPNDGLQDEDLINDMEDVDRRWGGGDKEDSDK